MGKPIAIGLAVGVAAVVVIAAINLTGVVGVGWLLHGEKR